jgi:uracil-DNA glycosylase family 4
MTTTKPGPLCHLCPLEKSAGPVWGIGSPSARLVRVGMCPGPEEIAQGEPFSGKSGQLLEQVSRKIGISRERSYTTNIVKCLVSPGQPLPQKAVDCCAPLIQKELEALQLHDTILTLGGEAFHAFTHKKLLTQSPMRKGHKKPPDPNVWLRGCIYPIGKRQLIPAVHPAYLLRTGFKDILFFERDLDRARRFAEGLGVRYEVSYNYTPSSKEIQEYIEHCWGAGRIGLDIETPTKSADEEESSSGNPSEIDVVGISAEIGYCMGIPKDQLALLKPLFAARPGKKLRMYDFNHGFDGYHLSTHFDMGGIEAFDVMKAFYLVYPDSQRHDLATALSWWTDMPYHKNLQFSQPDLYNAADTFGALWAGIEAEKEMRAL